jgi:hypothetical protein
LDRGDRTSLYCILDEVGDVILEHSLPTTPKGIHQVFSRIPRSRIALETGTHSPWVSPQLTQLAHEVLGKPHCPTSGFLADFTTSVSILAALVRAVAR